MRACMCVHRHKCVYRADLCCTRFGLTLQPFDVCIVCAPPLLELLSSLDPVAVMCGMAVAGVALGFFKLAM